MLQLRTLTSQYIKVPPGSDGWGAEKGETRGACRSILSTRKEPISPLHLSSLSSLSFRFVYREEERHGGGAEGPRGEPRQGDCQLLGIPGTFSLSPPFGKTPPSKDLTNFLLLIK